MSRTPSRYNRLLQPLEQQPTQVYLGTEVHLVGLLSWILDQLGESNVWVTTFSTSDDFLSGFINLRKDGLINHAKLLADFKASRKTLSLGTLMKNAFDEIYFGMNHSKLMLIRKVNGEDDDSKGIKGVTVVTSQNQTYGGRNESTLITSAPEVFFKYLCNVEDIMTNKSTTYERWL